VIELLEERHQRQILHRDDYPPDTLLNVNIPAIDPADLRVPDELFLRDLLHLVHVVHEQREVLELRPLVVGDPDGDVDVDGFLHAGHVGLLCSGSSDGLALPGVSAQDTCLDPGHRSAAATLPRTGRPRAWKDWLIGARLRTGARLATP
jgi:hypothetical protein